MARQSLILLALLAGCKDEIPGERALEMPVAGAVLQPETGGPFTEPIGFVASGLDGQIALAALKQGRYLTDDPTVAFLRTNYLATGGARLLTSVVPYTSGDIIDVFVGDADQRQLLRVPYITGRDSLGFPIEARAELGSVRFIDADDSGDSPVLTSVGVKPGYTTTEDWTITYNGTTWDVRGSRSGPQPDARSWRSYRAEKRRLQFFLGGRASIGDRFEVHTESGLREFDVGGIPEALTMLPDQSRLAMIVHDSALDRPVVRWFDPARNRVGTDVALPADAWPVRLDVSLDGSRLFVADARRAAAWEVALDQGDAVTEHVLPWPVLDVAPILDEHPRLYLARADANEVWVLDLDSDSFVDVNAWAPGVQGMSFTAAVRGLAALPVPYAFAETDADGVKRWGRSVAISLRSGRIVFMDHASSCLVQDALGPRTMSNSTLGNNVDFESSFDGMPLAPFLEGNSSNDRNVAVNPCAGIAKSETWTLRYDAIVQAWRVEGGYSDEQVGLAYEDERYVSDNGAISFVVRAGASPSQDGWTLRISIAEGATSADGDNAKDGQRDINFELPGDPIPFHYRVGPTQGGWRPVDDRPFVMVMAEGADLATRVKPQNGDIEVIWQ